MSVLPAVIAGICFAWLIENRLSSVATGMQPLSGLWAPVVSLAVVVEVIVFSSLVDAPSWDPVLDFLGWLFGAAAAGTIVWLGFFLFEHFLVDYLECGISPPTNLIVTVFGMPWFLL